MANIENQTKLEPKKKNIALGIGFLIVGVALVVAGLYAGTIFLSIPLILAGGSVVTVGLSMLQGRHAAVCPYCGAAYKLPAKANKLKCRDCGNESVREGEYLSTLS